MNDQGEQIARENEHVAPAWEQTSFHCMHCGVLAQQEWFQIFKRGDEGAGFENLSYAFCRCANCSRASVWSESAGGVCVDPLTMGGPRPHVDMPDDVRVDYEEARRIVGLSPRGACALLRLAVQKLCADLGEKGKNIDDDIASLVQKGLPVEVQQAMDSLRVIGNEAVHPGEMDLRDDVETATSLFNLLNFVVKDRIAEPKERKRLFGLLPERKREAIAKRDSTE
jgi:hypothetical protein